jgi:hypothetical protein
MINDPSVGMPAASAASDANRAASRPTGTNWDLHISEQLMLIADRIRNRLTVDVELTRLETLVGFREQHDAGMARLNAEREPDETALIQEREFRK